MVVQLLYVLDTYSGSNDSIPYITITGCKFTSPDGYMSSPERGTRTGYEEPYYSQYGTRGGTVTPVIDEEQG